METIKLLPPPENIPEKKGQIDIRKEKEKKVLLEQFKKTPIVQLVCEKTSISRATYYRWRKEDPNFVKEADEAIAEGILLMNDLAENQLLAAIRDRNLGAIQFWLRHRHKDYAAKVEVNANVKNVNEPLTAEQQKLIEEALKLASLTPEDSDKKGN